MQLTAVEILERLATVLRSELRAAAARHDLRLEQLQALHYLGRCNRYSDTPAALTEFLGTTKGTASQTLNVLERKGLIIKEPDPEDGRVVHCALSRKGRGVFRDTVRVLPELLPEDDSELSGQLLQLLGRMQRARGGRSFGVCGSCRHFQAAGRGHRCGLTTEALSRADSEKICREHEQAAA